MTITWIDGFDLYTPVADGAQLYMSWPNFESYPAGRFGGQCVSWSGASFQFACNNGATTPTLSVGWAAKYSSVGGAGTVLDLRSAGTQICTLEVGPTGTLIAKRGSTVLGTSSAGLISTGIWQYIEVEFTRHASAGIFKAYVNGVQALNLTAQNTGASDIDSIFVGATSADVSTDDLYCTNTATKLGECRIDTLHPTADTAVKDWTPSTGTANYACVDEATFDTTDYVSGSAVGNKDFYDFGDLSFNPLAVYAVAVVSMARKDDATTRTFRSNVKSSTSVGNGATRGLGTSFRAYRDIFETNPNGAVAWTQASVNAAQIGVEVVS